MTGRQTSFAAGYFAKRSTPRSGRAKLWAREGIGAKALFGRRPEVSGVTGPVVHLSGEATAETLRFAAAARAFDAVATASRSKALATLQAEGIITASGDLADAYQ